MTQETIQKQVDSTQEWFKIELDINKEITDRIRIAICREILKCTHSYDPQPVKVALLALTLAGKVSSPLRFTDDDVVNALWLVRDGKLGIPETAPITKYL